MHLIQSHETKRAHLLDREASLTDHPGGTARGKKTDILLDQALGQIQQSRLIVDGDDSCFERNTSMSALTLGIDPPDYRAHDPGNNIKAKRAYRTFET
jgi:hypothetical protein